MKLPHLIKLVNSFRTKGTLSQRVCQVSDASFSIADTTNGMEENFFEKLGMVLFLVALFCEVCQWVVQIWTSLFTPKGLIG